MWNVPWCVRPEMHTTKPTYKYWLALIHGWFAFGFWNDRKAYTHISGVVPASSRQCRLITTQAKNHGTKTKKAFPFQNRMKRSSKLQRHTTPTNQHPVDLVPNVRDQHQDSFDIVSHDHRIMPWQQWLTKNMKQDNTYGAAQGNGTVNDPNIPVRLCRCTLGCEILSCSGSSRFFIWV